MIEQEITLLNPFPGLRPFETEENELFFGRDGQSDEVLSKLRASRFVAVVGTSGSGKSSLVRAGLLPALLSGHMTSAGSSWRIAVFRPGASPIAALAAALSEPGVFGGEGDGGLRPATVERALRRSSLGLLEVVAQSGMRRHENLLILADQFEELFRFGKKPGEGATEDEPAAFVKLLLETRQQGVAPEARLPIYVILTMRSDYLGDCAHFRGLPEAINDGQYLIPRMTDDDRREAVNGPVILGGGTITAPLVNRLLNDAGEDPARLPILQHALMRTWDEWKQMGAEHRAAHAGDAIDLCCYEAVGGMAEALSLHADEAWGELRDERERQIAEALFKRLTEKEADHREGRRPATVGEICAVVGAGVEEVEPVIERFRRKGRSFLMPPPGKALAADTLIDISHESLIRGWRRLRKWVDEEAQSARQYRRLADTAAGFPEQESFLRDPALAIGLKWLEESKPTRAWAERYHPGFDKTVEYLEASRANRKAEAEEQERRQREKIEHAVAIATEQRKRVKQLRVMLVLLSLLLLGMLGATVTAFQQKGEANRQTDEADRQRLEAYKQRERAENALRESETQRDAAEIARKVAANQRDRAENALSAADRERAEAVRQRDAARRATHEADIQKKTAVAALDAAQKARDSARAAAAAELTAKQEAVKQRALAEARGLEAEKQRDEATKLLNLISEIDEAADYSISVMRGHTEGIKKVSFSPDDSTVVTSDKREGHTWDTQEGKPKPAVLMKDPDFKPTNVVYSDSGKLMLVTANLNGVPTTRIFEGDTPIAQTPWSEREAAKALFSPDDRFIVINRDEKDEVAIYDAKTGLVLKQAGLFAFSDVKFSPDGKLLVAFGRGQAPVVLNFPAITDAAVLRGHINKVTRVSFSPDSKFVVTAAGADGAWIWDARDGTIVQKLIEHEGAVNSAVFSPDGKYIVTTSGNRAYLWEAKSPTWKEVSADSPTIFDEHEGEVTDAVFTSNGQWVITISQDRTARVWPAKTEPGVTGTDGVTQHATVKKSRAVFRGHIKPLTSVDVSKKDSKYVVTGSEDRTARVWSLARVNEFRISALTVKAEPPAYTGKCPATVKFTGLVSSEGGAGTVKYRFVRSDDTSTLPQELTFDAPGAKQVSYSLDVFRNQYGPAGGDMPANGWVEIELLDPASRKSGRATYSVLCQGDASQQINEGVLTSTQLKQIMPAATDEKLALYLPQIRKAMAEFGINTTVQQAAFLAAVAVNTADLKYLSQQGDDKEFERQYGMRKDLGNFSPGDGVKYKGRGAFPITGRTLYQSLSQAVGVDLVAYPDQAASPEVAFRTAAVYWQRNGLNESADKGDIRRVAWLTRGGVNDLEKLNTYFERAKATLSLRPKS